MSTSNTEAGVSTPAPTMSAPIELVPDQLYLLGDSVELDGRVSWVPPSVRGWQPVNCYVAVQADKALVIDPGIYLHRKTVADQLESIIPRGMPVSIFVTRAEPDTTGGIGEIARRFPVSHLYAGGGPNPFDSFEAVGEVDMVNRRERIQLERMAPGFQVPVGGGRGIEVLRPSIRLLATWWGYDATTETLFTSDSFGHTVQEHRDDSRIITAEGAGQCAVDQVTAHLTAKFEWLAHAKTPALLESTRAIFANRPITRIAPAHGLVIEGRDMVEAHVNAMESALTELSS